ncbi:DUF4097 family beta strand repeat-containing protein [Jeotgalibacillus marinus]|uniref:DUF4097 domain-containing protein n=1 Tax=Jeotgalibacillus marinus TaxID=86667 RepID=A0ABV3Q455_9BACL
MGNERKRILSMVENGKITTKEALTLLESLEKEPIQNQSDSGTLETYSSTQPSSSGHSSTPFSNEKRSKNEFPFNFDEIFQQKSSNKNPKSGGNSTDRIMDFFQNAFEKVKDIDIEFNMSPSLEFTHTFQAQATELLDVEVNVANGNVTIYPWDEDYVKAECNVKVYRSDDETKARHQLLESVIFDTQFKKLRFISDLKMTKLDTVLYVPKGSYERWDIRLFSGKFQSESANVDKVKVKTAIGKIELSNMLIERGELEAANGGIDVSNTRADSIDAESVNGKISVEGAIDEMEVQSVSGNIKCSTSSSSARKIEAKTIAGSISIFVPDSAGLDGILKSNFGRFDLNHRDMDHVEEREELMQRRIRFTRKRPKGTKLFLLADAKTGAVSVKPLESKKESPTQDDTQEQ